MVSSRTKYSYTVGCIGRDMAYTLVSTWLLYYLTNGLGIQGWVLVGVGVIMLVARFWDAFNDPIMGNIVDNTVSKWGKFKPFIIIGALLNSIVVYAMFIDFGLDGAWFLVVFGILYFLWDLTFTINDIPYWSMLPSLTTDQKEREQIGSLARLFANVGLFVVTGAVPFVVSLFPNPKGAFAAMVPIIVLIFVLCQLLVVLGVKEKKNAITAVQDKSNFWDMFKVLFKNDQLLFIVLVMILFTTGYFITTSFGVYFFDYDYRGLGTMAFTIFAIVIALAQTASLIIFPFLTKRFTRSQLFLTAIAMVAAGYVGFMAVGYVLPMSMVVLAIVGFVLFYGQAMIQILILMFLADTIEYGQWKLGTRNESAIFSLQPFVNKLAAAFQYFVTTITLVLSGMDKVNVMVSEIPDNLKGAELAAEREHILSNVTSNMLLSMRLVMIIVPLILIIASYFVYRFKYKIDAPMYEKIIAELNEREAAKAQLAEGENA